MRKSDKKMENELRVMLTDVCEITLKEFSGFQWLTHRVNYSDFPNSLKIICIFDTNINLNSFMTINGHHEINRLIQKNLFKLNININNMTRHISYDTEENCNKNNNGIWKERH